eukprot:m.352666 g.352666  ORF g.352666 m.352666 type:complete len:53 (+) comp16580_c0_seq1:52-210(+)
MPTGDNGRANGKQKVATSQAPETENAISDAQCDGTIQTQQQEGTGITPQILP